MDIYTPMRVDEFIPTIGKPLESVQQQLRHRNVSAEVAKEFLKICPRAVSHGNLRGHLWGHPPLNPLPQEIKV